MSRERDIKQALDLIAAPAKPPTSAKQRLGSATNATADDAPARVARQPWAFADGVVGLGVAEKETCGKILKTVALKVYVEKSCPPPRSNAPSRRGSNCPACRPSIRTLRR